jgi:hypothetical protein
MRCATVLVVFSAAPICSSRCSRAGSTPGRELLKMALVGEPGAVDSNSSDADPASLGFGYRRRRWM